VSISAKNKVLTQLRKRSGTIAELAEACDVTRNAVNVQILQLISEGLVRKGRMRRPGGAGKPSQEFDMVWSEADRGSLAYRPFAATLLAVLGETIEPDVLSQVLEETGRAMARDAGLGEAGNFDRRLARAVEVVNSLGACAEVVEAPDGSLSVTNHCCPFATAVRADSCVCKAAAAFFSEATGRRVVERCARRDKLVCEYVVEKEAISD